MNRSALIWFAAGAGTSALVSIAATHLLSNDTELKRALVVYEPPTARDDLKWGEMSKDEIAASNLYSSRVLRECGLGSFNASTVSDGLNFAEVDMRTASTAELNCIFEKAFAERLPMALKDQEQKNAQTH